MKIPSFFLARRFAAASAGLALAVVGALAQVAPPPRPSPVSRPYVLSELNQHGIPPLLAGIDSVEQWERKKDEIRRVWLEYVGGLPARPKVTYEVVSEEKEPDHVRRKIVFNTVDGDRIPAFLLIPNQPPPGGKFPGILALHSTLPAGKASVALAGGMRNRTYGYELVKRGYVVLAPDDMTSGERIFSGTRDFDARPFYEKHPQWSTVGKNIVDHLQAVDLLSQLDFVDPQRLGVIGHSFGAYNAYFLAAFDDRIKVVVSSCGLNPFTGNAEPGHWGYRPFPYTHLPKITADLEKDRVPFEFNEIIALAAPRPMFFYSAQRDHLFPHWQSVGACLEDVHHLYAWLKLDDRFVSYLGGGDHDFPPEIRRAAYDFLDQWLSPVPAGQPGPR